MAVRLRDARKTYGSGAGAKLVLDGLNMEVPVGGIYGLLGASGCGKTTILSCIAGRLRLDSGDIRVLGGKPGSKGSGVPGPRIGYMPQEVALVFEMTARNTLYYFGWLAGMHSDQIETRYQFLSKLLELPPSDRLVKNLSGGQQRRVSFAAALVQTPELLILDEPTVGLDPVLRQSIWDYLVEIARSSHMTIIITTHYIEEATQAHKIGLLRGGKLLAETGPAQLVTRYGCTTLEEAYLLLSQRQEDSIGAPNALDDADADVERSEDSDWASEPAAEPTVKLRHRSSTISRVRALLYKDGLITLRNTAGILFLFLFPILQVTSFFLAIGIDPTGLPLGIVNEEVSPCPTRAADRWPEVPPGEWLDADHICRYQDLSCLFVDLIDDGVVKKLHFDDFPTAFAAARRERNQGVIHFPANFSHLVELKHREGHNLDNDTLELAVFDVHLDMSNYLAGYQTKKLLWDTMGLLNTHIAVACNYSRKQFSVPVDISQPVFPSQSQRTFMAPGVVITIVFYLNAMATATLITNEKQQGLWERNLVAGARVRESVLAYILSQVAGLLLQVAQLMAISFLGFELPCLGNMVYVAAMLVLQALAGITFGLLVSACCRSVSTAMYITMGSFFPYSFMVGVMWPLEGQVVGLRYLSYLTPGTLPTVSLENIVARGLGLTNGLVFPGFAITIAYIVGQYWLAVRILSK